MREWRNSSGTATTSSPSRVSLFDSELVEEEGFLDWFVKERRLSASPAAAAEFLRMALETDITGVLGSIRVSTLVLHRDQGGEQARYVADHIPHATIVELGGKGRWLYADDVADALLSFQRGEAMPWVPDSVLATLLFTDLVGSTERAAELGNREWRDVLAQHHADVRGELARYRGIEVDSAGDGFFCRFDRPPERSHVPRRSLKARSGAASRSERASTQASAS